MAAALDPRRHADRPDLADERLRGRVEAERFVAARLKRLMVPSIDLHARPRATEPAATEVLFGEDVLVFEENKDWAFVQLRRDGYVGYLAREALGPADEALTHQVATLWGYGFKEPDIKSGLRMVLPLGARVAGAPEGDFLKLSSGLFMPRQHVGPLGSAGADFVAAAERFTGTPYRWGGKTALGLDCSGLLQVSLRAAGFEAPRDSDMLQAEIGEKLEQADWGAMRRGDTVFWKGHCGVMADGARLLHANAHHMAVVSEPLAEVVARAEAKGQRLAMVKRSYALAATQV